MFFFSIIVQKQCINTFFSLVAWPKAKAGHPTATYTLTAAADAASTTATTSASATATSRRLPMFSDSKEEEDVIEEELPDLRSSPGTSHSHSQSLG